MSPKPGKKKQMRDYTFIIIRQYIYNQHFQAQKYVTNLAEPSGIFEIDSLSISLEVTFLNCLANSNSLFVQLTGTRTAQASIAIGAKILSLQNK